MHNVQPRLNTNDTSFADSRALESQLGLSQVNSFLENKILVFMRVIILIRFFNMKFVKCKQRLID